MRKYFFLSLLILIFLSPVWMWLGWKFSENKKMNILIIDKTVIEQPAQEHVSFCWILKNEKYLKWDGTFYDPQSDYMGFYPFKNYKYYTNDLSKRNLDQLNLLSDRADMVYFTDCYGIYNNDWFGGDVGLRSTKIYGGMNNSDLELMKQMVSKKKLVISEFNCMGSPTKLKTRNAFEELYRIKWTGWIGRYFDELDTNKNKEIPQWVVESYIQHHNYKWTFSGQGIILVNENGRVEILEERRHLKGSLPIIYTQNINQKKFNLPKELPYPFWFEINQSSRKNNIISVFKLNTNKSGDTILYQNNILKVFPAVIERSQKNSKMYYFAADFADNPIDVNYAKFKKIEVIKNLSVNNKSIIQRESFFYAYYLPLMKKILDDNYKIIDKNEKMAIPFYFTEK